MTVNFIQLHNHFLFMNVILSVHFIAYSQAYCWQVGWNPSFTSPPVVSEIQPNVVRVSWAEIVENKKCADNFLVKYWKQEEPKGYKFSNMTDSNADFLDITVEPNTSYKIQLIAREDKGSIGGIEYNKARAIDFTTGRANNILVASEEPIKIQEEDPLLAYKTITSGTCESNGLSMISTKQECKVIVGALTEFGFHSRVNPYNGNLEHWRVKDLYNLLAPFGCLFTDDTEDGVYWSEPINIHANLPCGSKNKGKQYFCFCTKKSES